MKKSETHLRGEALYNEINRFWDKWGTLDKHYQPDGGDSGQRFGMYYFLAALIEDKSQLPRVSAEDFKKCARLHHPSPGVIIRHPNKEWDASDWDRNSPDQGQPCICAFGEWDREEYKKFLWGHLKRGLIFWGNTRKNGANKWTHGKFVAGEVRDYSWKLPDVRFFDIWGNLIRAGKAWYLYPLLVIFDVETFVGAIQWRLGKDHNIALNHTVTLLQAYHRYETPLSVLARWIMPFDKLIALIGDHLDDFDQENTPWQEDMLFFKCMFEIAVQDVYKRKWYYRPVEWLKGIFK